ncbi:MAG TPA: PAS domain-containing protein, partial [Chitinophagaceae bacterium]|nr:PAS domain-containing protein [Chitinophagaceae bacterium]
NDVVKACVFTFNDITQQDKLNKDLKILLLAAKKVSNSVVVTDSKRKIVWVNDAFISNTGYSFEEVEKKVPGHFLQGKETDPQTVKFMREHLHRQLPFECEIQNYRKNGEKFWMRLNVQPLFNDDNSLSGYLGVGTNITEQKKLQEKLIQQKVEAQKEITRATIAGQEKERNELGRELHDNINQILAAAKIQLECHLKSKNGRPECITNTLDYLKMAIAEIRNLSRNLVAPRFHDNYLLDEIGLVIEHLGLKQKTTVNAGSFDKDKVSDEIKLTLFRILQEQLNNIIKYAKARSISVILETDDQFVKLFISDDGIGFDTNQKRNGIGLNNIHNRVELHDGRAKIISAPGKGCHVQISIPLQKP